MRHRDLKETDTSAQHHVARFSRAAASRMPAYPSVIYAREFPREVHTPKKRQGHDHYSERFNDLRTPECASIRPDAHYAYTGSHPQPSGPAGFQPSANPQPAGSECLAHQSLQTESRMLQLSEERRGIGQGLARQGNAPLVSIVTSTTRIDADLTVTVTSSPPLYMLPQQESNEALHQGALRPQMGPLPCALSPGPCLEDSVCVYTSMRLGLVCLLVCRT